MPDVPAGVTLGLFWGLWGREKQISNFRRRWEDWDRRQDRCYGQDGAPVKTFPAVIPRLSVACLYELHTKISAENNFFIFYFSLCQVNCYY